MTKEQKRAVTQFLDKAPPEQREVAERVLSLLGYKVVWDYEEVYDIEREVYANEEARKAKAASGAYAGGRPPFGYRVVDHKLVIDEKEAEVVRLIFQYKGELCSVRAITDVLEEKGYVARNGKPFSPSTVQSIWDNERFYYGWHRYGKDGEWVKAEHEPIMPGEWTMDCYYEAMLARSQEALGVR